MDTIVWILILLTAFNFLLKQTFWKPVAVGAAAGIAAIFVILMLPYAIEQSKTQIGDCFANGILPVGSSRGQLFSGEETYDAGISPVVLVPGGVDYSGLVFRSDASCFLFSRGFV